ncbi:MAG: aldo/keto reductase [Alphaproteobacteria bacterium]|nr:aldo/keto reductase [Alphaproteobacteria bacterium]
MIDRLWLGAVQLGLPYGLSGRQPDAAETARILDAAWDAGLRRIDCARAYGAAETRVGDWLRARRRRPIIATKIPSLAAVPDADAGAAFRDALAQSQAALGVERLDYLLLHDAADLRRAPVRDALLAARERGLAAEIGLSCYAPDEALSGLDLCPEIRLVQAPGSLADRRVASSGLPGRLARAGGVLVLRSLFLQGALLAPDEALPAHLAPLAPLRAKLAACAAETGIGAARLALALGLAGAPGAHAVLGVDSVDQAEALADLAEAASPPAAWIAAFDALAAALPPGLVDPRTWPQAR